MICYRKRLEDRDETLLEAVLAGVGLVACVALAWLVLALVAV